MANGKRGGQELAEVLTRPTCPVTFFLSCLLDLLSSLPMDYSKASLPSGAFLLLFARRVSGLAGKAGPCYQRLEILALFIWRPPRDKVACSRRGVVLSLSAGHWGGWLRDTCLLIIVWWGSVLIEPLEVVHSVPVPHTRGTEVGRGGLSPRPPCGPPYALLSWATSRWTLSTHCGLA